MLNRRFCCESHYYAGGGVCGPVSGLVSHFILTNRSQRSILISVAAAHFIGSILIKSFGIYLWYGTPLSALWLRVPIYLVTGTAEAYLILLLFQSRAIIRYVKGPTGHDDLCRGA